MKILKIYLVTGFFGFPQMNFAQADTVQKMAHSEQRSVVEEQAEYPGGLTAMSEYLRQNIKVPKKVAKENINGKVFAKFVINEDGSMGNVEILKGIAECPECDEETLRVIKAMPAWKPARINGRAVKCFFNLPLIFKERPGR